MAERAGQPKVGIVGAGPAGLSCAYFLARLGYRPTVFEQLPVAGGMLAVGIPEYRLPKAVLRQEIAAIEALGVEIRTNTTIGKDLSLSELQRQGYQAFFIAAGAHHSHKLGIPGEELEGVVHATDFLREVNLNGRQAWVGRRVAVVGGGNAAIDAARTALRLGAEQVTIVYRRTKAEMPALKSEIEAAEAEGVEIRFLAAPTRIVGDGRRVKGLECQRMKLGKFDRGGRRQPVPMADSAFELDVDMIVPAIGQFSATDGLCDGLGIETDKGGLIRVDKDGRTNVPHIFAGGDMASGPATVIKAIAAGERGAVAIDQYLYPDEGRVYPWRQREPADTFFDPEAKPVEYARCEFVELPPALRRKSFDEIESVLDREMAVGEARRCLRCDYRETEE